MKRSAVLLAGVLALATTPPAAAHARYGWRRSSTQQQGNVLATVVFQRCGSELGTYRVTDRSVFTSGPSRGRNIVIRATLALVRDHRVHYYRVKSIIGSALPRDRSRRRRMVTKLRAGFEQFGYQVLGKNGSVLRLEEFRRGTVINADEFVNFDLIRC